ncbi:uncharacterized protein CMC5_072270 [Chondromyces crocatus]|uniref:Lipoprotein n=1 Tax=Chondromyces crocatus TaxID=52 RepID=A0A0K1EPZ7_CHOCO|nr:uncharacterized protein CMC5_072270 [Chondromyces crocatus]
MAPARRVRGALIGVALIAAPACGTPSTPVATPPPATAPATRPPGPAAELNGRVGEYHSTRFDLALPLPDGVGWRVDDASSPWLAATHASSTTTLLVRTWRPNDRVHRALCETQARTWRKLPGGEGSVVIEQRRIDAPAGFDTVLTVGIVPPVPPSTAVEGFAVAFGGRAFRCFAYAAATHAEGPDAAPLVATRLAALVELSLAGVHLESELTPARPASPRPPAPRVEHPEPTRRF